MARVVELTDVHKTYRGAGEVLAGVDLAVEPGTASVVLGANGSGKSTLLRIAAGCSAPSRGRVRGRAPVVGYLPASSPPSRLPVRTYLRHLGAIHGSGRNPEEVLEELGFTGSPTGAVSDLSSGNAQKVGLAQALAADAGLLVLDEPWTALDDAAAEALSRRLDAVSERAAVLLADHTGRAGGLRGAAVHHLVAGRLEAGEGPTGPVTVAAVDVVLRCPGPAGATAAVLPTALEVTCRDRTLEARVAPSSADAWLAEALALGCSVRSVRS